MPNIFELYTTAVRARGKKSPKSGAREGKKPRTSARFVVLNTGPQRRGWRRKTEILRKREGLVRQMKEDRGTRKSTRDRDEEPKEVGEFLHFGEDEGNESRT